MSIKRQTIDNVLKVHRIPPDVVHDFSMPHLRTSDNLSSCKATLSAMIAEIIGEDEPVPQYRDFVTQSIQERYYLGVNKSKADARQRAAAIGFDLEVDES